MSVLEAEQLSLGYDGSIIVDQLDLPIAAGQITVFIGPNGCGKSTLLRGFARLLKPHKGAVLLDGRLIHTLPTREVAKRLGFLPQSPQAGENMTVRDLIAQGRYPHQRWFQQWSIDDEQVTDDVLQLTGLMEFADRPLTTLSGGQRQCAWIAMALAQDTEILLLDEPTTYLDMAHQIEVLHLIKRLNEQHQRTIVMILHDLNHAARYAHHVVALSHGAVVTTGSPWEVITPDMIRKVFGVEAVIIPDPQTGRPCCLPYALCDAFDCEDISLVHEVKNAVPQYEVFH